MKEFCTKQFIRNSSFYRSEDSWHGSDPLVDILKIYFIGFKQKSNITVFLHQNTCLIFDISEMDEDF